MFELVRNRIVVIVTVAGLVAGTVTAVALAAPAVNSPSGIDDGTPTATETATETPEATETAEATATATGEAIDTPEATETPEADEDGEHEDADDGDGDDHGVPLDSPACQGDLEEPSSHDTDDDGDGCREIETDDDTTMNLPDPAADAHDGNPGTIGDEHGDDHEGGGNEGHDD